MHRIMQYPVFVIRNILVFGDELVWISDILQTGRAVSAYVGIISSDTVKEDIFVGEKLCTFPSKTFRVEFNFVLSN